MNGNSEMREVEIGYEFVKRHELLPIIKDVKLLLVENGKKDEALDSILKMVTAISKELASINKTVTSLNAHDALRLTLIKWCIVTCGGGIFTVVATHFTPIVDFLYKMVNS